MPLVDLVTPWAAAAADPALQAAFRARWADHLDLLRRQRVPLADHLPLTDPARLAPALARVGDPSLVARLRTTRESLDALGISPPKCTTLLMATSVPGEAYEVIPSRDAPVVVLCLDRMPDEAALVAAWARALTTMARWLGPGPSPVVPLAAAGRWDIWEAVRDVPLAEWIYTAGVAEHAAAAVQPAEELARQFGVSRSTMQRLREQERALRARLAADLPLTGLGPWLRWMAPGTPPSVRRDGGPPIPAAAGRYLAWRLTADRVARLGVGAALGEPA